MSDSVDSGVSEFWSIFGRGPTPVVRVEGPTASDSVERLAAVVGDLADRVERLAAKVSALQMCLDAAAITGSRFANNPDSLLNGPYGLRG